MSNAPYPIHAYIDHLINQIPGLSFERRDDFSALVSLLCAERSATTLIAQLGVFSYVSAKSQEIALNNQRLGHIDNLHMQAAENIFCRLDYPGQPMSDQIMADVRAKALKYATDAKFRAQTMDLLEAAGHSRDAVDREADRLGLGDAAAIERLALSTARRSTLALKELIETSKLQKKK